MQPVNNYGATISDDGNYRFKLWRIWDDSLPKVLFIMHNPSTADENLDDPTIRRCMHFARSWGYGGIYVGNLIPWRCTDPKDILAIEDPNDIFPDCNGEYLQAMVDNCALHVLAYGNPVIMKSTVVNIDHFVKLPEGKEWHCIKQNKTNHPAHPLYLRGDLQPIKFINKYFDLGEFNAK